MNDEQPAALNQDDVERLYYEAAREGQDALLAEFLRQGVDPDQPAVDAANDMGRTPLMFAVMFSRRAMVDLLLDAGANPALADVEGNTALDLAAIHSDPAIAERLKRAT